MLEQMWQLARGAVGRAAAFAFWACMATQAVSGDLWSRTFLLDAYIGSSRSAIMSGFRDGGYELDQGRWQSFDTWYEPRLPEINVQLLSQVTPEFGVIWGFGTGERAEKYTIQPSLHVGFSYREEVFDNAFFSVTASVPIGGKLREKTCSATYGDLGTHEVNCRLAASELSPDETLAYLARENATIDGRVSVGFVIQF